MAFDDHLIDRGQTPHLHDRPTGSSPVRWVLVGAGGIIVGVLLTWWWMSRAQPGPATPVATAATDVAVGSKRPKAQPVTLPALDASDLFLRKLVETLSQHPILARLLATEGLVRNAALSVVQIGEGRTPFKPLAVMRPTSRLAIVGGGSGRIDPGTYARWEPTTASLLSVNPSDAAQLYVNVKPLFDEAYGELGHPNGNFDDAIVLAIRTLTDTPELKVDPVLLRRQGYYEHEDPNLRGLLPVQKQLLLIGPSNRQRLMNWLKQLAEALDLKVD